jgi:regulator of protease activity HflC (stomatin/prohibitin superfamily)
MQKEQTFKPGSGWVMLTVLALMIVGIVLAFRDSVESPIALATGIALSVIASLLMIGFFIIEPNNARVMVLFGTYKGTVKENGFFWANPFFSKKLISLRARNFNSERIKVNDRIGNPVEIASVIVWQVKETAKALFEVDDFKAYVILQSEAAVRSLAGKYSYDDFGDEHDKITLRGGGQVINDELEKELVERLELAGIHVIEARISHLAYAPEIAGAMLQRQQASAIVAARTKIVDGAVGMVEMALQRLAEKEVVHLDNDRKAAMVSNLMVVLCSEKSTTPIVNAGA